MGEMIELTASDGHILGAYRAEPDGVSRGGLIVIQEIFGVNGHIRDLSNFFASAGYTVLAPALFDRIDKGIELGYGDDGVAEGRALRGKLDWDGPLRDVEAAVQSLRVGGVGKVGAVGYCWGASVAWLTACRLPVDCVVGYYGGQIAEFKDEQAGCPVVLHFGDSDPTISMEDIEAVRAAQPNVPVHVYQAGHGFNCDQRGSYDAASTRKALPLTLELFARHIG